MVRRLAGRAHSLSFYFEFALANYREPLTQKLLAEAGIERDAIKDHEREPDLLSEPYLTRVKRDLKRLQLPFRPPSAAISSRNTPATAGSRWRASPTRPTRAAR